MCHNLCPHSLPTRLTVRRAPGCLQTVAAIAEAVWSNVTAGRTSALLSEMPLVHAQLIAGALTEHVAHRYLLLHRVRLPPGTMFKPPPVQKPLPSPAQWQHDAHEHMQRCLHRPLTTLEPARAKVNLHKWLGEQVLRRHEAENAPVTKLKMHGQLACNLEHRLLKRLVRETAEWWHDSSRADSGAAEHNAGYLSGSALAMV